MLVTPDQSLRQARRSSAAFIEEAGVQASRTSLPSFARMVVPQDWPPGAFDLILFSEVLYYLDDAGRAATARLSLQSLSPGGAIVLVNWHGPTDGFCTGDDAAEAMIAACAPALQPVTQRRAEKYRLDVLAT